MGNDGFCNDLCCARTLSLGLLEVWQKDPDIE